MMQNALVNSMLTLGEAATTTFSAKDVMQTALDSAQGEMFAIIGIAVPAIAAVTGVIVASKFGLKWLRSLGKG